MNEELWIRLRSLQTHPAHGPLRDFLVDALSGGARSWGAVVEALAVRGLDLEALAGTAPESPEVAEREAVRLHRAGIHMLTPASPEYSPAFLSCADPPLTLTVKGSLSAMASPALAVVGSREPGPTSVGWMESHLPPFLRRTGAVIASGGARGIDQRAHALALRAAVPTIAFLPSGIENPYPSDFRRWFGAILDGGGAVVSEYPAMSEMRKQHFHHRNRLIAAAGRLVLVVEARERSGTLITATRAAEIGRPLLVVPAHPSDVRFAGNLQLLSEGATMARHHEDLTLYWQAESDSIDPADPPLGVSGRLFTEL